MEDSILKSLKSFKLEIELIEGMYINLKRDDWKQVFQNEKGSILRAKLRECCGEMSGNLLDMRLSLDEIINIAQERKHK